MYDSAIRGFSKAWQPSSEGWPRGASVLGREETSGVGLRVFSESLRVSDSGSESIPSGPFFPGPGRPGCRTGRPSTVLRRPLPAAPAPTRGPVPTDPSRSVMARANRARGTLGRLPGRHSSSASAARRRHGVRSSRAARGPPSRLPGAGPRPGPPRFKQARGDAPTRYAAAFEPSDGDSESARPGRPRLSRSRAAAGGAAAT